jgi:uncharacterized membrane protein YfcA
LDLILIPVFLVIGCVVGFIAGLLGVGGGMTMIPLLTLIFSYEHFPADVFLVDDRCHRDGQLAE